nr:cysteine-rich venom protein LEI1-like [Parasteatoda tepidariorum]
MKNKTILLTIVAFKLASYLTSAQNILRDPWLSDDNEDFDLYDIITMAEASLGTDPYEMTDEEREEVVHLHNVYRGNFTGPIASGSDVQYMEYNMTLEHSAKLYASICQWKHGRHPNDSIGEKAGQNLYKGPSRNLGRALYLYYMEYPLYSYENHDCINHKMCDHFIVMMWGLTNQIGCARVKCHQLKGNILSACHYWPRGNMRGSAEMKVYQIGRPCSRNPRGDGNLCHKNLCVNKTLSKKYNLDTTCESFCQNCAVNNIKKCTCECKVGWDWNDCAEPCADLSIPLTKGSEPRCRVYYRWDICPDFWYNMWCRKHCLECKVIDPKKPPPEDQMCCGGKMCDRFYVLNYKCECELLCPSKACIFNITEIKQAGSYGSKQSCERLLIIITLFVCHIFKISVLY